MIFNRLTLVALVAFSAISTDLYLPGIPMIVAEFGATNAEGQFTLAIFMGGLAVGQLIYGPLSDHYGRKPVLYIGLGLYIASSLACALASSMEQLLLARLLQALAAACGPVLARAIVNDIYQPRDAASVMAILAAAMALIPMVAPILGSWMLYWFDWRALFYMLMVFGVLVFAGALRLAESNQRTRVGPLHFASILQQFVRSFRHPGFIGYMMIGGAHFGAMFAWISCASFVVIEQFAVAPEHFGYTFAWVVFGYVSGSYLSSRLVLRLGMVRVIGLGVQVGIVAVLLILFAAVTEIGGLILVLIAVFGIFMASGLVLANCQAGATAVFPEAAGQSSSVFGFCQTGLAGLTSVLIAKLYHNDSLLPLAFVMGLLTLMSMMTFVILRRFYFQMASEG